MLGMKTALSKMGRSPLPQIHHSDPTPTNRHQQLHRSHRAGLETFSKLHVGSGLKTTHRTWSHYMPLAASSSPCCWDQNINTTAHHLATPSQIPFIPLSSHFCQQEAFDKVVNWHWGTYSHRRHSKMRVCRHSV